MAWIEFACAIREDDRRLDAQVHSHPSATIHRRDMLLRHQDRDTPVSGLFRARGGEDLSHGGQMTPHFEPKRTEAAPGVETERRSVRQPSSMRATYRVRIIRLPVVWLSQRPEQEASRLRAGDECSAANGQGWRALAHHACLFLEHMIHYLHEHSHHCQAQTAHHA
jgi:hypothetical protein